MHFSYTWEMFFSDLGGIYGFTLGISIISILELFDFLLLKVTTQIKFVLIRIKNERCGKSALSDNAAVESPPRSRMR